MRTICFVNLKGGVAKTATTVNVAAILAKCYNKRVLIKDKQAARCMGHPGSWGYGRTLTVAETGYIGRVLRPAWCMGKKGEK